MNNIKTVT